MKSFEIDQPNALLEVKEYASKFFPNKVLKISIQESYDGNEYEARILLNKGEVECLIEHLKSVLSEID